MQCVCFHETKGMKYSACLERSSPLLKAIINHFTTAIMNHFVHWLPLHPRTKIAAISILVIQDRKGYLLCNDEHDSVSNVPLESPVYSTLRNEFMFKLQELLGDGFEHLRA